MDPERYAVIPRCLVFLTRGDDVLLLKGAPHKRLWAGKYNGIGGHIEPGEDPLSAARRELIEETGLTASRLWLCGTVMVDTGESLGIGIFVFKGVNRQGEPRPSREGLSEWIPTSRVWDLPLVEDLPTLLPPILALQPGDPPFSAAYQYDGEGQLVITFASSD